MEAKKLYLLLIFLATILVGAHSQYIPKGISYQAIARDEKGFELKNAVLEVRLSIIPNDPIGVSEYCESHTVTTDKFGLFTLVIGQGSYIAGAADKFSGIDWGSGIHYLKVEVDFGAGFKSMGTTQFLAVPYALYAASAANANSDPQKLSYNEETHQLILENGGTVDLSTLSNDDDNDPLNELQVLSYSSGVLTISKGNEITINVNDADADPINEIQNLGINGHQLSISGGNEITIPDLINDADADSTNEIQMLSYSNNLLSLSKNGGSVYINVDDADASTTNELQSIRIGNDKLTLTNDPSPVEVNLSKYLDNTDSQSLTIEGSNLSISGGNTVPIDVSNTNELQAIQLTGDVLSISKDASNVNLSPYKDNTDNQTLSVAGNNLSISGGNTVPLDVSNTNELQAIQLTGDVLSISKDASTVNLSPYKDNTDNQTLSVAGSNLSISGGNTVPIDVSNTNEIQALQLSGDVLSITKDAATVNLNKYLDNTDSQTLSKSGYTLSLQNGGTVNLRPDIIAFRALKTIENSKILYANDSMILVFPNDKINISSGYNNLNGKFTVPAGGEGLYNFDLNYQASTGQSLSIKLNGNYYEQVLPGITYNFLLYLNSGDYVEITLKSSGVSNPQAGTFSGYRIH